MRAVVDGESGSVGLIEEQPPGIRRSAWLAED
jgi:hypothetical protein